MIEGGARHFPEQEVTYLNCAAQSPLPNVTVEAMREAIGIKTLPNRMPDMLLFELPNRAREAVAPIIGVPANEIFLGSGMSHGSNAAAHGFPWTPGDEVILTANEFPANIYIWGNAARRAGARAIHVRGTGRGATTREVLAAVTDRTRAIMVSLVDFGSGQVQDVEQLAAVCRARGIFLGIDGTQAAGVVPLDVSSMGIQLFTAGCYKWMLGPYGAGFAWLSPDWYERIDPTYVTWTAAAGAENFNSLPREDWTWVDTARRYDAPETASFVNTTGMARSAEFLVELGVPAIHDHVTELLDQVVAGLPAPYRRRGEPGPIASPILLLETDDAQQVHRDYDRLRGNGFWVSLREDGIRVSPHVFNTPNDIDRFLRTLAE